MTCKLQSEKSNFCLSSAFQVLSTGLVLVKVADTGWLRAQEKLSTHVSEADPRGD